MLVGRLCKRAGQARKSAVGPSRAHDLRRRAERSLGAVRSEAFRIGKLPFRSCFLPIGTHILPLLEGQGRSLADVNREYYR